MVFCFGHKCIDDAVVGMMEPASQCLVLDTVTDIAAINFMFSRSGGGARGVGNGVVTRPGPLRCVMTPQTQDSPQPAQASNLGSA